MPYYDFECPACGAVFDTMLTISERDRGDVACPECGHEGGRRLLRAPNIGGSGGGRPGPSFAPT